MRLPNTSELVPWLAVAGGGAIGSVLRYLLELAWPENFGVTTLLINVAGSFALAYLISTVFVRKSTPSWLVPALGPGLLGGFTTMSGFALWSSRLGTLSFALTAVYFFVTVLAGLVAAWAGFALAKRLGSKATPHITDAQWPEES